MTRYIVAYALTAILFGILDYLWLTRMAPTLYRPILGDMLADSFRVGPALAFYVIYMFGIVWFALKPSFVTGQWTTALLNGAIFGFIAYATYDLTNQATLRVWSTKITLYDMAWGAFATSIAAALASALMLRFYPAGE